MAYKTVKAGQVHGAGGGDTLSLFPRDSVLHWLKKTLLCLGLAFCMQKANLISSHKW